MRRYGIRSKLKRKFKSTTNSMHKRPVADNIIARDFKAKKPNSKWSSNITHIWTEEGWLYLSTVIDLYSRKIVEWSMNSRMNKELVNEAFKMAIVNRKSEKNCLISHSDRGSQYASYDHQKLLNLFGVKCSMNRKGNCWDNSPIESFFASLKKEHVFFNRFKTKEEAKQSIFEWIEVFYNRQRIHSSLGYLSPVEYGK